LDIPSGDIKEPTDDSSSEEIRALSAENTNDPYKSGGWRFYIG
jgi:hypothetical protein